jgi:hypothetical protein
MMRGTHDWYEGGGAGGGLNERVSSSWLTAGNEERADRSEPRLRRHMRTKQYRGNVMHMRFLLFDSITTYIDGSIPTMVMMI